MAGGGETEGDWKCNECESINYALESLCSKCKQSRNGDETKILPITTVSMVNLAKPTETIALRRGANMHGVQPANNYGVWPTSIWALAAGNQFSSLSYGNQADKLLTASKGWQNGDWICTCGFHKCSPRAQNIDTNSLGSWEDGANGWLETLFEPSMSQKSDSLLPADWSRVLLSCGANQVYAVLGDQGEERLWKNRDR